jgi:hypothetical protein
MVEVPGALLDHERVGEHLLAVNELGDHVCTGPVLLDLVASVDGPVVRRPGIDDDVPVPVDAVQGEDIAVDPCVHRVLEALHGLTGGRFEYEREDAFALGA